MVFSLDDIFLYQVLGNNKNMYMYEGCQTYKYELFLKFIVKLFAVLNQSKAEPDKNEIKYFRIINGVKIHCNSIK